MTDNEHGMYPGTDFWPVLVPPQECPFDELFGEYPEQPTPQPRGEPTA